MAGTMKIELANGNTVLFGAPAKGGLQEISLRDSLPSGSAAQFEKAMSSLGGLVEMLEKQVAALAKRPSSVEIEFGASLSGECDLWIVSGHGEAEFKVTLKWEKGD